MNTNGEVLCIASGAVNISFAASAIHTEPIAVLRGGKGPIPLVCVAQQLVGN